MPRAWECVLVAMQILDNLSLHPTHLSAVITHTTCVLGAAGVYCSGCTCKDCVNVPEQAACVMQERQKILQRSPRAFSSKVAMRTSPK